MMLSNDEKIKGFDKIKERELKYRVKQKLLLQKCQEKGIVVTEEEIQKEIKRLSGSGSGK